MYAGGIGVWGSVDLFLAMTLLAEGGGGGGGRGPGLLARGGRRGVTEAGDLIRQADAACSPLGCLRPPPLSDIGVLGRSQATPRGSGSHWAHG